MYLLRTLCVCIFCPQARLCLPFVVYGLVGIYVQGVYIFLVAETVCAGGVRYPSIALVNAELGIVIGIYEAAFKTRFQLSSVS